MSEQDPGPPQITLHSQDPNFCFERSIRESIACESLGFSDLGPTDSTPLELRELEYLDFFGSSPLTTPCSSAPSSPSSSRSASPKPAAREPLCGKPVQAPAPSSSTTTLPPRKAQNSDNRRNKERARRKRAKERIYERADAQSRPLEVSDDAFKKCLENARPTTTSYDCKDIPAASSGFICRPDHGEAKKTYTLKEYIEDLKFTLQRWDGKTPIPILDAFGRIVAVLAGHPNDPRWNDVHQDATAAIRTAKDQCRFPVKAVSHRRGKFPALNWGISYGGGQKKPGNLYHSQRNSKALLALTKRKSISRIAGYGSKAFALWAPKLFTHYETHFDSLLDDDHSLRRNWPNNVWASFAVNFGPKTVCSSHRDFANVPYGWCSITALGDFDPTKGGHLVLWDLKLVVEFPPGSTILIPSSAITHCNIPIGRRETRYSFTQFSAGGLFRWVEQGFQCTPDYMSTLTAEGLEEEKKQQDERCKLGLSLFSTMSSLSADRAARKDLVRSRKVDVVGAQH